MPHQIPGLTERQLSLLSQSVILQIHHLLLMLELGKLLLSWLSLAEVPRGQSLALELNQSLRLAQKVFHRHIQTRYLLDFLLNGAWTVPPAEHQDLLDSLRRLRTALAQCGGLSAEMEALFVSYCQGLELLLSRPPAATAAP